MEEDGGKTTWPAGYSGTPLAKKLGIKPGFNIKLINAPEYYFELFTELPADLAFNAGDGANDLIHFFTKHESELITLLPALKDHIKPSGMIWVSWPKKSSKVETDITEDTIRNFALKIGLVDIKVCAVDEIWSGLKLVIHVKDRGIRSALQFV
jgi:hypothetical protein